MSRFHRSYRPDPPERFFAERPNVATLSLLRNIARVLRDDQGALDSDVLALAFGATALASGVAVFAATDRLEWAAAAAVVALPLQLLAMASRLSAAVIGVIGTVLVAGTTVAAAVLVARLGLQAEWTGWLAGVLAGAGMAWLVGRTFRQAVEKLGAGSDWY
jgi:hypothetical protein